MPISAEDIWKIRHANIRYAARIAEKKAEYYGHMGEEDKKQIALEVAKAIRVEISPHGTEPETCPDCHGKKGKGFCMGYDDCPGCEHTCEGWGAYCCHCGADYAKGQM